MENDKLKQDIVVDKLKIKQMERKLAMNPNDNNVRNSLQILKKHLESLVRQQNILQ